MRGCLPRSPSFAYTDLVMHTRRAAAGIGLCLLGLTTVGCFLSRVPPEAVLVVEKLDAATFRFSALDSTDPDGAIVSTTWDFGDGTVEAGLVCVHTYEDPGEYAVTVELTDDDGLTAQAETAVTAHREIRVPEDYATIQAAIDAASDGDTITLAAQTFHEYVRFDGKAITVRGESQTGTTLEWPGLDVGPEPTSIVTFDDGETRDSVLENLTIQGGAWTLFEAGAIRIVEASPTIRECIISSHGATFGGAVSARESGALFEGNRFLNNRATIDGGAVYALGKAVFPDFVDNEFDGNMAAAGGAICLRPLEGAGIAADADLSTIRGNVFSSSQAIGSPATVALRGGAIHVGIGVRVILGDNEFIGNSPNDIVYEDTNL